jgi:hypothetical protein
MKERKKVKINRETKIGKSVRKIEQRKKNED